MKRGAACQDRIRPQAPVPQPDERPRLQAMRNASADSYGDGMNEHVVRVADGWQLLVFRGPGAGELVINHDVHLRAGSQEIVLHT